MTLRFGECMYTIKFTFTLQGFDVYTGEGEYENEYD